MKKSSHNSLKRAYTTVAQPWSDSCILLQTISDEIEPAQRSLQFYNEATNQVLTIPRAFLAIPVLFWYNRWDKSCTSRESAPHQYRLALALMWLNHSFCIRLWFVCANYADPNLANQDSWRRKTTPGWKISPQLEALEDAGSLALNLGAELGNSSWRAQQNCHLYGYHPQP